jgi:uncharacterized protein YegP (UPF0339 family)
MAAKYVISKTSNGKFHFVLKAANSEVILSSQTYADLAGAKNGIDSVKASAAADASFKRLKSSRDEPYFTLVAANGQVVGQSEMYSSERARDNGIDSVKRNAPVAGVDDRSADKPAT